MCILTREAILAEIESGRLSIEPLDLDQVGPASIDLHLGDEIRALRESCRHPIHVTDDADPEAETKRVSLAEPYLLAPGATVLGITRERLDLPPDLCAWIEGRSRIARLGLTVHATSGFVQPGARNHQVLEMSNVSRAPLALHAGARVCQIVLERTEGRAVYRGQWADQTRP
ncbi:MAG: dCTP deaminase [Myxococcota bacterium]